MKRWLAASAIMGVTLGGTSAPAADAPAAAASAPATPYKRVKPLPPPEGTAVQRSKEATIPGDFRPEREPVPQLRIPLGKGTHREGPAAGGVDDSVARCRAKRTSEERERCEANLDNI